MNNTNFYVVHHSGIIQIEVESLSLKQDSFKHLEWNEGIGSHHIIETTKHFNLGDSYYSKSENGVVKFNDYSVNALNENIDAIKEEINSIK